MILDQPQTVMLSSAVQETSEDVVAPTSQAVRAPSLKTSIWQCLIKLGQGTVEFTSGESNENSLKTKKLPERSKHSVLRVCELSMWRRAHVSPWAPDTLRLLSASLHSCGNGNVLMCRTELCCVILSAAQQILWRIQTHFARHLSDTSVLITRQRWELWMPF